MNNSFLIAVRNRKQTRVKMQQKRTKYLGRNKGRIRNSLLPLLVRIPSLGRRSLATGIVAGPDRLRLSPTRGRTASASCLLPFPINSINKLICLFVASSFSLGLISVAYAQEENSRAQAKQRRISVPFFEEERRLDFTGFSNSFLNDALGGTGNPMGGNTPSGSDFTMSPNVSGSENSDPSRGVSPRGGMMRGSQPNGGGSGDRIGDTPMTGGGGRGIFQQLPPR